MIDFIEKQMQASDRMFKMMFEDHVERLEGLQMWADMNTNLIKKLEERDAEIKKLRAKLLAFETAETI
jgi:hypothetical protein